MPNETQEAVDWALQQSYELMPGLVKEVSIDTPSLLVDYVRQYFNEHGIEYDSFDFYDVKPYAEQSELIN